MRPPVTPFEILCLASVWSKPIHTETEISGVYAAIQISRLPPVMDTVPVFPATGVFAASIRVPVPFETTDCRREVIKNAFCAEITCLPLSFRS